MEQFNHEKKTMEQSIWINLWICTKPNGCQKKIINIYGAIDILVISQYHFRV